MARDLIRELNFRTTPSARDAQLGTILDQLITHANATTSALALVKSGSAATLVVPAALDTMKVRGDRLP